MTFHLVAGQPTETNVAIVEAVSALGMNARLLRPGGARRRVRAGDVVLGRVDVLRTLDGVESCLWELRRLERHGARVLNGVGALLAAHDKLVTAVRLARAGIPHPRTVHLDGRRLPALDPPVVLKPRFGRWGRDVIRCDTRAELAAVLQELPARRWFHRHGVLAQELVPSAGDELRILVARGAAVGAVARRAPGDRRTAGSRGEHRPVDPPAEACRLATGAADAIGADLAVVDLLPSGPDGYVVLELNAAEDFDEGYSPDGTSVFAAVARRLVAAAERTAA